MVGSRLTRLLNRRTELPVELGPEPTRDELRAIVHQYKAEGLCGRRIAEQRLGPYFIASDEHGQREIDLLDEVLEEAYAGTDLCLETRRSECSRFRGGCKGNE